MTQHDPNQDLSPQDQALRARLAKLRTLPVNLESFDRQLRAALPPTSAATGHWSLVTGHLKPLLAIAATLLLLASAAFFIFQSSEVRADPSQMVQMHEDLIAGRGHTMPTSSLADAQRILAAQAADSTSDPALKLPRPPTEHLMACCMKPLSNKKVACVLLDYAGTPVTMSVGKASDIALPRITPVLRNSHKYYLEESKGYHMVMTAHGNLWICLIAKLPPDDLLTLADQLQF